MKVVTSMGKVITAKSSVTKFLIRRAICGEELCPQSLCRHIIRVRFGSSSFRARVNASLAGQQCDVPREYGCQSRRHEEHYLWPWTSRVRDPSLECGQSLNPPQVFIPLSVALKKVRSSLQSIHNLNLMAFRHPPGPTEYRYLKLCEWCFSVSP